MARSNPNLATTPWVAARKSVPSAVETELATTVASLPSSAIAVEGWRGIRAAFISNGANDESAVFTLYGIDPFGDQEVVQGTSGYRCQSLGTITVTLGTSTAVANTALPLSSGINNTWRWADTVVWAATTYGSAVLTYIGGNAGAFSPADNTIGELLFSDVGNFAYIALVCTTYSLTSGSKIVPLIKSDV